MIRGMRTECRPIEQEDQTFIFELNQDPAIRANVVGWDFPSSLDQQVHWYNTDRSDQTQRWLVQDFQGTRLGLTGLWDIDWHNRNALTAIKLGGPTNPRGQGFGTDAILSVMAYAFYDVGLERLHSTVLAQNVASRNAYVKHCGWTIEGTARQHVWRAGKLVDLLHIGVLRSDFATHPRAGAYRDLIQNEVELFTPRSDSND